MNAIDTADLHSPSTTRLKAELIRLIVGNWISQSVYAAVKLGVIDVLGETTMDVPTLAKRIGAQPTDLRRLLRALEGLGLFRSDDNGHYSVTETGALLRADRPDSLQPLALFNGEELYEAWREMPYAVQTGKSAFERVHGASIFDYLATHGDRGALFDSVMATVHGAEAPGVVNSFDFSRFKTVVDIGGGKGSFVAEILEQYPELRGIVFDLPHAVERADQYLAARGLLDRCETRAGNFFDGVPEGADAYLLRHVLHDWRDPEAGKILAQCRKAMGSKRAAFHNRGPHSRRRRNVLVENPRPEHAGDLRRPGTHGG